MSKIKDLEVAVAENGEFAQVYYYPTKDRFDVRLPKFEETDSLMMGQGTSLDEAVNDLVEKVDQALGVVDTSEPDEEPAMSPNDGDTADEPEDVDEAKDTEAIQVAMTPGGKDHLFSKDAAESMCGQVDRGRKDFVGLEAAKDQNFEIDLCGSCRIAAGLNEGVFE